MNRGVQSNNCKYSIGHNHDISTLRRNFEFTNEKMTESSNKD